MGFYTACAISALNFLHERQIVYRMIDPNCLGVDAQGYLVLYDFILAKDLSADGGRTSTLCGAKEYFAPEMVAVGSGHGVEVDIWALGILLYEVVAGAVPFS